VLNASEAMPDGGRIRIGGSAVPDDAPQEPANSSRNRAMERRKSGSVEISVTDNGIGVLPEAMERVFDPFFTSKDDGSGLGLAAVHQIVEEHGGNVRFESVAGEGTIVRVRFPRGEVAA
jgi:signal transduction histidine kinase